MLNSIWKTLLGCILLITVVSSAEASFHTFKVNEIYSNADGSIQFVELREASGLNGQNIWAGHTLTSSNGTTTNTFTFSNNLPSSTTANRMVLVATQAFANLGLVQPDYIIPAGFLFPAGGTLNFADVSSIGYASLPVDGILSRNANGSTGTNSPTNFAGISGTIPAVVTPPQSGWWWNPAEGGRGFMIEFRGTAVFMATFLYDSDGRANWYVSSMTKTNSTSYQGALTPYANGQTLTGSFKQASALASVGNITLSFSSATQGTLTWPGGTIPIERYNIVANGVAAPIGVSQPESGWWWNESEGGRGWAIEIQAGTAFIAGFMYDTNGNPIWYLTQNPVSGTTTYQGTWVQYGNGQTLTGSFHSANVTNANVGAITIQFDSTTTATLRLPDGRMLPIKRFIF